MPAITRAACFAVLVFTLPFAVAASAQNNTSTLTIDSPLHYQVFQRQTARQGFIIVRGHVDSTAVIPAFDRIAACIRGQSPSPANNAEAKCHRISYDKAAHTFNGKLASSAGGFYTVEVRLMQKGRQVAQESVDHVAVGEVFVISGQSNSTNYGEVRQTVKSGYVTTFDGKAWRIADDPQPGVQDRSSKGSFIPSFGDAMYAKYPVPIGIASVGHGSTSVRQWLPRGGRFTTQPTMTRFTSEAAPGVWECDGTLFDGMMTRIHELDSFGPHGKHGFRALLWHQGESDAHQKPPHQITGEEYRKLLTQVIVASRKDAGWKFPWFVAEVSYHTPDDPLTPEIRDAQESLWHTGLALQGPDTDQLTGMNRQNHGAGVHMSDMGLKAHGQLWAGKVSPWLVGVLAR
jgi:Carbohydrate esterase, sialic acid-specific acetylesterase